MTTLVVCKVNLLLYDKKTALLPLSLRKTLKPRGNPLDAMRLRVSEPETARPADTIQDRKNAEIPNDTRWSCRS
jgi:hypothetical protein